MTAKKVPVPKRALVARINRALARNGATLRAARGAARESLGDFYTVREALVVTTHVDLESFARKLRVLQPFEELSE